MTVEVNYSDKPALIVPKKRIGGKKPISVPTHVDHVIVIQGSSNMTSAKVHSIAEAGCLLDYHKTNGKINGFKNSLLNDLPMIPDDDEKCELSPNQNEERIERPQSLQRNGYQFPQNLSNSREIVDLSPIYENSSDACSSHDDVRGSNDIIAAQKIILDDNNDSNSTPNSISHSEASLELGLLDGTKRKKRVNIVPDANYQTDDTEIEISALKCDSEASGSPEKSTMSNIGDGYLIMNGTIKRGKKKGQSVDVTLNMSREELEVLEANIVADEISKAERFKCSASSGVHVMIWSLICLPFVVAVSGVYSFYVGTITWYNIFVHVSEAKKIPVKVFVSPFVILLYPFLILLFTVSLGIYAGVVQLTYDGRQWWKEVCDFEKGFYGWLCGLIRLSDCSPYEVVILTDLKVVENTDMRGHSSTEDLSI